MPLVIGLTGEAAAQAASWPDRPVKLILPYAPGGATDLIGRPWADKLSQVFGQQFVIENRGGAGGMIGTEAAAKSAPDGYTFLLTPGATLTILPHLRKTAYDPIKSFAPVGRVGDIVSGFVINPAVGVKTFKEMVEYAKKNPGKLAYGSAGLGTATHLRIEMLKFKAGIDILHVPYRGSADALNDLLPNTVQMMNEINVLPHVKSGKLRALGMGDSRRSASLPDIPTIAEAGVPGYHAVIWNGLFAPRNTPRAIIERLNREVVRILQAPDVRERLNNAGFDVAGSNAPEQWGKFLEDEIVKWTKIAKLAGMKAE
jgi:tripartite-type tricarboxylate transporter receptor subunit TctC